MIYSRSAEYAIRAFVHLAQVQEGKYAMVKNIAEQEGIPAHFLAKILQQLARKGLLRSSKGPTGGFALRVEPSEIRLLDIVEALDGLAPYQQCASGLSECSDEMPCSMHDSWIALRSRIMDYLGKNTIADLVANLIIAQLLFLEAEDPEKDISIYINSPGGSITAGLAILDTMAFIRPDIVTICVGQAASMAAVLLAKGSKGKRFSLPNSRIMIHQPSMHGLAGQAADIDIYAKEILRMRETLNKILAEFTGQPGDRISRDVDRDYIMSPDQGVEYGMIDKVVTSRELTP